MRRTVVLDLEADHQLARDIVAGGVFVPGADLVLNEECTLVLRHGDSELQVAANCVWVDGDRGAGLQLVNCDAELKNQIAALAQAAQPAQGVALAADDDTHPADDDALPADDALPVDDDALPGEDDALPADDGEHAAARKIALNVHERLRGLTLAQQVKVAQTGEVSERIVLERMYGKTVWEALLRNPRITGPEVARIARMGALPRPQIETIVGNGAWLQIPEVRRALLANPRLGTDQILRVLRLLPKHELKLAAIQTAYPHPVRDAAKRMIREMNG